MLPSRESFRPAFWYWLTCLPVQWQRCSANTTPRSRLASVLLGRLNLSSNLSRAVTAQHGQVTCRTPLRDGALYLTAGTTLLLPLNKLQGSFQQERHPQLSVVQLHGGCYYSRSPDSKSRFKVRFRETVTGSRLLHWQQQQRMVTLSGDRNDANRQSWSAYHQPRPAAYDGDPGSRTASMNLSSGPFSVSRTPR